MEGDENTLRLEGGKRASSFRWCLARSLVRDVGFPLSIPANLSVVHPPSRRNERPTLSLSQGAMERKGEDETGCPGPVRAAVAGGTTLPKVEKVRAMGDRRKPQATVCGYGLMTDWQWAINHPA